MSRVQAFDLDEESRRHVSVGLEVQLSLSKAAKARATCLFMECVFRPGQRTRAIRGVDAFSRAPVGFHAKLRKCHMAVGHSKQTGGLVD